jgi:hypothetical protein
MQTVHEIELETTLDDFHSLQIHSAILHRPTAHNIHHVKSGDKTP